MHVLVTADTVGGVWTYTRELVCGLLSRGHRVTLVSFGKLPTAAQTAWMKSARLRYHATTFPLEWMQDAEPGLADSIKALEKIIAGARPDLLHFSQFCYAAIPCAIPKVVVGHSDVVSWWKAVHNSSPVETPWHSWYRELVSRGLAGADVVVTPSNWMMQRLAENYGQPSSTRIIYNGRSANLFKPKKEKSDCVLSVGRLWDAGKQIGLLLAHRHPVPVRIAGSVHHPDEHASVTPELEGTNDLTFCGEQDEAQMRDLYSDSAIYAATSRYEPFGLAPVEAALSRCALIVNDIPAFRELWGDAAFYFRRNDADSLAEAICALCIHPPLRQQYADRAYEHARSRFDSGRMVDEYETLYHSLLGARAAA